MRRLLILTSMLWVLALLPYNQAQAQQAGGAPKATEQVTPDTAPTDSATTSQTVKDYRFDENKFDENKYVEPEYPNLARLYWHLGILDINNAEIIDNYLAITDCQLYLDYKDNDFEWREIREHARESIRRNYKSWPSAFKMTIPLYLRDYHPDEEYFDVDTGLSAVNSVRRIQTIFYRQNSTCRKSGEIIGYPPNLVLFLNRPFLLSEIPVERELARVFIDESNTINKKALEKATKGFNDKRGLRLAYLEIYLKVHSFKELIHTDVGRQAVVFSQIDHIRVYADSDKRKLLYERNMYEESGRKRRKRNGGPISEEELNLPEGNIFGEPKNKK